MLSPPLHAVQGTLPLLPRPAADIGRPPLYMGPVCRTTVKACRSEVYPCQRGRLNLLSFEIFATSVVESLYLLKTFHVVV